MKPDRVAALLNVATGTVKRWAREGSIKAVKVGGQWRIPAAVVRALRKGGRYAIRRPGCTAWTHVQTIEQARDEQATANRDVQPGHIIVDEWTGETVD